MRRTPRPASPAAPLSLLDAIADDELFAPWFSQNPAGWTAWFAFLKALFGLPMSAEQGRIFRECTGRTELPSSVFREAVLICGRRAGKSQILALISVWLACFHSYKQYLAPGERAVVLIIAADRKQARVILRFVSALLKNIPALARLIEREWQEGFDLKNSVSIEIATSSFKSTRGYTLCAVAADELAYWSSDENSANPDTEVLKAIRPAMATIPTSMLLIASSPYARRGALWDAHRLHFGKDNDPTLVWQAATQVMNPSVPQAFIDAEYEKDPASAAAEFGAMFRSDIESFVTLEAIEACVSTGIRERPPESGLKYAAFADPSGGGGRDSFTISLGHLCQKTGLLVVDCIRERKPPFSPADVVEEYANLLKSYGVTKVTGDRYAGEWVREPFKQYGITYDPSALAKSDLYRDALPLINSKKVDLLDHRKMIQQFVGLEIRASRSGRMSIDHNPSQHSHDDICNAVSGLLKAIGTKKYNGFDATYAWAVGDDEDDRAFQQARNYFYLTKGRLL